MIKIAVYNKENETEVIFSNVTLDELVEIEEKYIINDVVTKDKIRTVVCVTDRSIEYELQDMPSYISGNAICHTINPTMVGFKVLPYVSAVTFSTGVKYGPTTYKANVLFQNISIDKLLNRNDCKVTLAYITLDEELNFVSIGVYIPIETPTYKELVPKIKAILKTL